jgi:hypothetical protein
MSGNYAVIPNIACEMLCTVICREVWLLSVEGIDITFGGTFFCPLSLLDCKCQIDPLWQQSLRSPIHAFPVAFWTNTSHESSSRM